MLHRFGRGFAHVEVERRLPEPASSPDLRNPLSVLGPPAPSRQAPTEGWQYLIASSSSAGDRPSWTLLGPPTSLVVEQDATPEHVASTLAAHGWSMVLTSPQAPSSSSGTINYIFRRPIP